MTHALPAAGAGDRPFLISGADDRTARVWDYQTKACMQTLASHHPFRLMHPHPEALARMHVHMHA